MAHGLPHRNVELRTAQYRASFDEAFRLRFARELVAAKIANQRTILRRNWRGDEALRQVALDRLSAARKATGGAGATGRVARLRGRRRRDLFPRLRRPARPARRRTGCGRRRAAPFRFEARNRRPPLDPVNAMLSLAYAMLARHLTVALATIGLDPYRGFFHAPRYGRPALALDMMEPFRPIIADSVVLSVVNTGEVGAARFRRRRDGHGAAQPGRRRFVEAFERRMSQETTHPLFGYRLSACAGCCWSRRGCWAVPAGRARRLSPSSAAVRRRWRWTIAADMVTYDIGDAKRWRRVFKTMNGYGEWLQLSVFQCRLTPRRRAELETRLRARSSSRRRTTCC